MSEIPDVVGGTPINTAWGNPIKDRTVMRYANAAARDASIPAPLNGDTAWLLDTHQLTIYTGATWRVWFTEAGGDIEGDMSATSVSVPSGGSAAKLNSDGSVTALSVSTAGGTSLDSNGDITAGGKVEATDRMFVSGANQAELWWTRDSVAVRWRFRINASAQMVLESSLDGVAWQVEETWTRA